MTVRRPCVRVARCMACALLCCMVAALVTASSACASMSVAGVVDIKPRYASFVLVRVVDVGTGAVIRIAPIDATHTFSFAAVPDVVKLQAVLQPSERHYRVDDASSVLEVDVNASSVDEVRLRIVVLGDEANDDDGAAYAEASADHESSLLVAVAVMGVFVCSWVLRHRIVSLFDSFALKPQKPRRVYMVR